MARHHHPSRGPVVVIGGGLTGLSAALTWALHRREGERGVVLLEKNRLVGGAVASYKRHGFAFDTTQMCSDISDVLDHLGLEVPLARYEPHLLRLVLAGVGRGERRTLVLPAERSTFVEALVEAFPHERRGIRRLMAHGTKLFREICKLKYAPRWYEMAGMLLSTPRVIKYAGVTTARYLAHFGVTDPGLLEVFEAVSSLTGLPSRESAGVLTMGVLQSLLDGAYRIDAPAVTLPLAMARRIEALGGEVRCKAEVSHLHLEGKAVHAVELVDGTRIQTDTVILGTEVEAGLGGLVGWEVLDGIAPKYAARARAVPMTGSAMVLGVGLDRDVLAEAGLDGTYTILSSGLGAFQDVHDEAASGQWPLTDERFYFGVFSPGRLDGGPPRLVVTFLPVPGTPWIELRATVRPTYQAQKEAIAAHVLGLLGRHLVPGLEDHVTHVDLATPATISRYTGSVSGAMYDMASIPENFGLERLPMVTPVRGLDLPKFAHGVFGTLNGGMQVVDLLLGRRVMRGASRCPCPR